MASSSSSPNLLGKRKWADGHKETSHDKTTKGLVDLLLQEKDNLTSAKELYIGNLSPNSGISDIIDYFKDVGRVVRVLLNVNFKGVRRRNGYVVFASAKEANKALEKKNGGYICGLHIVLGRRITKKAPPFPRTQVCLDHKVCHRDYIRRYQAVESLDESSHFDEGVLFVANLSPQTKMLHIEKLFESVGEVVSIRLIVNHEGKHVGYGFVEFACSDDAKKAMERKNGEWLHDHKIFLDVANKALCPPQPKFNLAEKLCYEDYLRRQNLVTEEEDETSETPAFVEGVAVREKTLFVTCLSSRAEISHIIDFFKDVGEVVHVRLIVENMGNHVGDGFVEFASADGAKKALKRKNGEYLLDRNIFLVEFKNAPYSPLPEYCIDHNVWYEDYLQRENLLVEEEEGLDDLVEEVAANKKTIFIAIMPHGTKIGVIKNFFSSIGQVVRLRLIVDDKGEQVDCCFIEFPSADEAKEALKKKNNRQFYLDVVEIAPYPLRPKYNLAEKLCSQVEESLKVKDDDDDLETKMNQDRFCGKRIIFSYDD